MYNVASLLKIESTARLALRIFALIACQGDPSSSSVILDHLRDIVAVLEVRPLERDVNELAVVMLARAMKVAPLPIHDLPDTLVVRVLASSAERILRSPPPSHTTIDHALTLLMGLVQTVPREFDARPESLNVIVACLRSRHLQTRAKALSALVWHARVEDRPRDLNRFFGGLRLESALPTHLLRILDGYGRENAECTVRGRAHLDWLYAMGEVSATGDLHHFGKTLATLARRHDTFLIGPEWNASMEVRSTHPEVPGSRWFVGKAQPARQLGGVTFTEIVDADAFPEWMRRSPPTDASEQPPISLPFSDGITAFAHCARALRQSDRSEDLDDADILEINHLLMVNQQDEGYERARAALTRNPHLSFAHYVLSLSVDREQGLAAAERGLSFPDVSAFERNHMLWTIISHCIQKGLHTLVRAESGDPTACNNGLELLRRGLEMAETYMREAPPDGRYMLEVLGWYAMLTIVVRGPEVDVSLHDLEVRQGLAGH